MSILNGSMGQGTVRSKEGLGQSEGLHKDKMTDSEVYT